MEKRGLERIKEILPYAALLAVLVFSAIIRLRLAPVPLDRDDGGWAYSGWLLNNGFKPYEFFYEKVTPAIFFIFAFILKVFGNTTHGVHHGLLAVNAASSVLIFLTAAKFYGKWPAAAAAAFFSLGSLSSGMLGFSANMEHFIIFFFLLSAAAALKINEDKGFAWAAAAGFAAAVTVLIKHAGIFHAVSAAFIVLFAAEKNKKAGAIVFFMAGAAAATLPLYVYTVVTGQAKMARFFIFDYAFYYGSRASVISGLSFLAASFAAYIKPLIPMLVLSLPGIFLKPASEKKEIIFLTSVAAACFLSFAVSFQFRSHYYLLLLPFFAMLTARAAVFLARAVKPQFAAMLFLACAAFFITSERNYLFYDSPESICEKRFAGNPFNEAAEISAYIKNNSLATDRVAVLGSEPEIYFNSGRLGATGFVYMYYLMISGPLNLKFQKMAAEEIERAKPRYIVMVRLRNSWLFNENSEREIFSWFLGYKKYYSLIAVYNKPYKGPNSAPGPEVSGNDRVELYERKKP